MDKAQKETKHHPSMLHSLNPAKMKTNVTTSMLLVIIVLAVLLGTGTGYVINSLSSPASQKAVGDKSTTEKGDGKTSAGVLDKETFTDQAEGILKEGGIEGEGSYHLERPGGEDQKAYLTSSAVDLSTFVGKKVRVWGQTFEAEKAGWLMDVGYVEVIK